MKPVTVFILWLTFLGCNNSNLQTHYAIPKSVHIPDTTNNWYAKLFDYSYYITKTEIAKRLKLEPLEKDTSNSEIRVWIIGSNYDPQKIISLKKKNNSWKITEFNYYSSYKDSNSNVHIDSISTQEKIEKVVSQSAFDLLKTEQIWQLPSQSEMKNGDSYGCVDGYALLIEMSNTLRYKFLFYMCPSFHISKDSTFQIVSAFQHKLGNLLTDNNLKSD
jgi:hypothetical protein